MSSHRLPNDTIPENYVLELSVPAQDIAYTGTVTIGIRVQHTTNSIVLNSLRNRIVHVRLQNTNQLEQPILSIEEDPVAQTLTINTMSALSTGSLYQLTIRFENEIRSDVSGFYYFTYPSTATGELQFGAITQFEAIDARTAFPCYDEPGLRATFTIIIDSGIETKVYSNMPVAAVKIIGEGMKQTRFQSSPPMPTYLVAFAITTDFVSSRVSLKGPESSFNMELVAPPGSSPSARQYGLELGALAIRAVERHFQQTYDLPKLDQLAVPKFYFSAMENWGLVVYEESYLLYDESTGTNRDKENVITTIVHEFVHQFFGNLLTPHWWSDVFLSEGFATFYEYYISSELEPSIRFQEKFTVEALQTALLVDSVSTIRPLSYSVPNQSDIMSLFDIIAYQKGGSILRMFHYALGESTFLNGVRHYIRNNKGSSVTPEALFASLQFAAEEDAVLSRSLNVTTLMGPWIYQSGYPLVTVELQSDELIFHQSHYTTDSRQDTEDGGGKTWSIPVTYQVVMSDGTATTEKFWLPQGTSQISIPSASLPEGAWILANPHQTGYYRVNYDANLWLRLIQQLTRNHEVLPPTSRGQLLDDGVKLYLTEHIDAPLLYGLLQYIEREIDTIPWIVLLANDNLGALRDALVPDEASFNAFTRFAVTRIRSIFELVQFDGISGEPHEFQQLRSSVIEWSCRLGVTECRTEALTRMMNDMTGTAMIPSYLKESVYCGGATVATLDQLMTVWLRMQASGNLGERSLLIAALGCAENSDFLDQYLASLFDPNTNYQPGEWYQVLSAVYSKSATGFAAFNRWSVAYTMAILQNFGTDPAFTAIMADIQRRLQNLPRHYELVQLFMQT
ncbi:thyrotropin-releasing hormone-degrading ectoenzyme-like [Anopheles darlingi]|uniref:thyrotropin-releasing hormone-degrading ectoenzyme-like n=1 Tax=Anopheles darlingi TaxID=43151 RepID=UPI0021002993|nr:thyrotropin-releasing hormone-degrading ectoenzyme-like [Anopheles darlingi]